MAVDIGIVAADFADAEGGAGKTGGGAGARNFADADLVGSGTFVFEPADGLMGGIDPSGVGLVFVDGVRIVSIKPSIDVGYDALDDGDIAAV